jgi:hypothetical protein
MLGCLLFVGFLGVILAAPAQQQTPLDRPQTTTIPDYVTKYAPVVHLYGEERYLPYHIDKYVRHFAVVTEDGSTVSPNITSLAHLGDISSGIDSSTMYMKALTDFSVDPEWITGKHSIPDITTGEIDAPAVVIVTEKPDYVDAFWFYFYSFNLGPFVMGGGPYGNHIGDWEHSLVRFDKQGNPLLVWMSAHGGGAAYTFDAMEKLSTDSNRPVIFAARGTHANYATVGQHSHDIPYHMLSDFTDRGPLWDPAQNYLAYKYNDQQQLLYGNGSHCGREEEYGQWLKFTGHWGDKKLAPEDPRQRYHPFEWRMIDGPLGPLSKNLHRDSPCQRSKWWNFAKSCWVRSKLDMGEGIEGEGGGCALVLDGIRPQWLGSFIELMVSGGVGCFIADRLFG